MSYDDAIPEPVREPGYYYHYKHDPTGPINNYAYFIEGGGIHTEEDCRPEDRFFQVYRPLYDAHAYQLGKFFDCRPLALANSPAERDGERVERFTRITDPYIIGELRAIKRRMYPPND